MLEIINAINFLLFIVLVVLVAVKLIYRWLSYRQAHEATPLFLKRDLVFFIPFTAVILFILFFRWQGVAVSTNPLWLIASGSAVNGGLAYVVYVEYFRVDSD